MAAAILQPGTVPSLAAWNEPDRWQRSAVHTSAFLLGKGGKRGKQGKHGGEGESSDAGDFDTEPHEQLIRQAVAHFKDELSSIHSGRASPGLLEPIEVPGRHAHERPTPLKTYGTVTARSPTLLVVSAYDSGNLELVAKAIRESPLRLAARVEGKEVHVPIPRPTLEQIKGMLKLVAQESEKGKTSIRGARHKAIEAAKTALKARDDRERANKEVQALTDKYVAELDRLRTAKEKELQELK